ncbi:MAG: hypothetical protein JKY22_10030 [Flavobacteriaceae bacterium]|nr:hypothetical protein [Flavobacteriaceae bacterium]
MTLLDISICTIIFLIGFNLKNAFSSFDKRDKKFLNQLFFFHFTVAIVFNFLVANGGGDAIVYWNYPKYNDIDAVMEVIQRGSASGVVYLINYLPSHILELSFFTGNMGYALLGFLGFIYLYRISKEMFPETSYFKDFKILGISVFPWIWFLPNLHFWSSGIGKDTLLFFCIALFVYSLQHIKKRLFLLILSMLLSLVIRPHITLFLIVSFGIGYTLDGHLKSYQKVIIFLVFAVFFGSIFNYVMDFVKLESLETQTIEEYTSNKAAKLNQADSSSGLDISGYPYPIKVFTFLYRPLFFDVNGVMAILASLENLILLLFTIKVFRNKPIKSFKKANFLLKGTIIYFILGALSFSLILGNLGIMLRQKNMFYPLFFIFGFWAYYRNFTSSLNLSHEDSTDHK